MTQVNPSISPEQEDVFTSTEYKVSLFPDKNEPSLANALFDVGVQLRYNLRSQKTELLQMDDEAIIMVILYGGIQSY